MMWAVMETSVAAANESSQAISARKGAPQGCNQLHVVLFSMGGESESFGPIHADRIRIFGDQYSVRTSSIKKSTHCVMPQRTDL